MLTISDALIVEIRLCGVEIGADEFEIDFVLVVR